VNVGLAKFSDILRNKKSLDLKNLTDDILNNLVKYVNANQGAIFILEGDAKSGQHLEMLSCYAYSRKKFLNKRIEIGEGLVGQCVLEKQATYMTKVPEDYLSITSGLGAATPREVLISPLLINDDVFGVLEIASFDEFHSTKIDFINKLSENIASTIKNVKDNERTISLLNASQQQAEELRAQEEEMRQNMEEMQATQEEMARKSDELERASAEMEGVLGGINATMATIEFTPVGIIKTANKNFLKTMECTLEEISGKHHKIFVPKEILESPDYNSFWKKLAAGQSFTGNFKRITSKGKTVWLNAIYNPILNSNGDVIKVVKFATDITAQQESLAESRGVLEGINATMATIEFTPDGTIQNANSNFLNVMECTADQIKGKHHKIFVPQEVLESDEYKTFWERLAHGEKTTGIFKRISLKGKTIWLNAIYNPILNANGTVYKVLKFATDITAQQEMLAEGKGVLAGINNTMATIEFKPDGTILNANSNFLKVMETSLDQIRKKHHKIFVPQDVLNSEEYKAFWSQLASGEPRSGIFKRMSASGKTVWLNAIYNPILNANGDVFKVIKFATEVNEPQNRD
jgi:methyl-accepting chemotaxis protein